MIKVADIDIIKEEKGVIIMNISMDDVKRRFGKAAKKYSNDKVKTGKLVNDAVRKADKLEKSNRFVEMYEQLQLLFGLVIDWINGSYRIIPKKTIAIIIMGILYFVSPIDFIPDFLPGGFLDDAFVLGLVMKQVYAELEQYQNWKMYKLNEEEMANFE